MAKIALTDASPDSHALHAIMSRINYMLAVCGDNEDAEILFGGWDNHILYDGHVVESEPGAYSITLRRKDEYIVLFSDRDFVAFSKTLTRVVENVVNHNCKDALAAIERMVEGV